MLKTLAGLAPFAVGLIVIGIAIWWLLGREMTVGRWLLGGFIGAHGLIHLLFVVPQPAAAPGGSGAAEWPFDLTRSWLFTGAGVEAGPAHAVGLALIGTVVVGCLLAGLATAGVTLPASWWPVLVAGSAAVSVVLLGLFFNSQLLLGLTIDAILLWVVMAAVWSPAPSPIR